MLNLGEEVSRDAVSLLAINVALWLLSLVLRKTW